MIKVEAMNILRLEDELNITFSKFKASNGPLSNLIKRKNFFCLRRITSSGMTHPRATNELEY